MTPKKILNAAGGIDVVSPETEIPADRVRVAENVVLHNDGGFDLRKGATIVLSQDGVHSLWQTADGSKTLAAIDNVLCLVEGTRAAPTLTALGTFAGGQGPVRYAELGGSVYAGCVEILRVAADNTVTRPGVASMLGTTPIVAAAAGGLVPGTYGVAYSVVNASGEESGLTDVTFVELTSAGGLRITFPTAPTGAVYYRVYRTTADGGLDLRRADTIACTSSFTIVGGEPGALARNYMLDLLPAGTELAAHGGRLYSVVGNTLFYSMPFNAGLCDARDGFIQFPDEITMVQPVENGIFVGTAGEIFFLSGMAPKDFKLERAAGNGAFKHSPRLVDATMFNPKLVDTARRVALWLSPIGYQLGLPGGAVASPQADRMRLADIDRAPTIAFLLGGVKQIVTAVETMTLGNGGATDTTP